MKIGMISGEYPPMPGGVGDFTRMLSHRLMRHGHDVRLLCRAGCKDELLPMSTVASWGFGGAASVRAWARRIQPDVVNLQFQTAAYDMSPWVHFLPGFINAPFVTTFHDLRFPYLFPKAGRLRDWIVRRLARASAGVITTNQEDEAGLQALSRRRVIPIGSSIAPLTVSVERREQIRQTLGALSGSFVLGHFGFLNALKGIDHLLEAMAGLRRSGRDLRLVFIGGARGDHGTSKANDYAAHLDAEIERLGLGDAVWWTGYLDEAEVAVWLGAVDLVALPFADGASYRRSSLMAAVALGCAILTTQPAFATPAFRHGDNLWLAKPRSAEAIAEGIRALMTNSERLCQLRNGARQLRHSFAWERIAKETADFYREVAGGAR
ncbi:MAG: glycosyltransferase family 4 protein [Chloroflexi bacterium]|nr:glycosyltransferase family 4 protein [Chloroflexota bacterium]MCY4248544.1 glycosyltransferase family 4 protein [Chloroflexota bacterium]